tara:strand:- start:794 stop:1024 length:231 start_codon:yes stop_codon:yes gene_type:complete
MKAQVEITDTFGGEANYSWVNRYEFDTEGLSDREIIFKARKLLGLTGVKTVRSDLGDTIVWDVQGECVRAFLTLQG